jgi:hypothetical protein
MICVLFPEGGGYIQLLVQWVLGNKEPKHGCDHYTSSGAEDKNAWSFLIPLLSLNDVTAGHVDNFNFYPTSVREVSV